MSALNFILPCVNFLFRIQWISKEMYKKPELECPLMFTCCFLGNIATEISDLFIIAEVSNL